MRTTLQLATCVASLALSLATPVWAEDTHHPITPDVATAPAAAPAGDMMAMMPAMMKMMSGMMPGMMSGMMPGMGGPADYLEGRIAFLQAELEISAEQQAAWTGFADALRLYAKGLANASSMAHDHGDATGVAASLLAEEHMFDAKLAGLKAINAALGDLGKVLTEDQLGTLDTLLPGLFGMPDAQMMGGMSAAAMAPQQ